jgi:hypothetical protein
MEGMVALRLPLKEARQAWIESFESVYLREVLSKSGGNVTRAAERAKVSRRFLQRMIARLGIRPADVGGTDSSKILSPLTLRLSGQDPIAPTETPAAVLASSDEEECTMRKAVLVGLLGFVAEISPGVVDRPTA